MDIFSDKRWGSQAYVDQERIRPLHPLQHRQDGDHLRVTLRQVERTRVGGGQRPARCCNEPPSLKAEAGKRHCSQCSWCCGQYLESSERVLDRSVDPVHL